MASLSSTGKQRVCDHNNFMMDFENYVLSLWDARQGIPTGLRRYKNEGWAKLMKSNLEDSDTCWEEYVAWVDSGGGDEWFEEEALFCTKHQEGPLDVWYDCHACVQEVREGPMPRDGRYICDSINGRQGCEVAGTVRGGGEAGRPRLPHLC